jgi:hypothetical protein
VLRLPGLDSFESAAPQSAGRYYHVPPWEPPAVLDDRLELDGEPDIDPDDIDPERWADELEDEDS